MGCCGVAPWLDLGPPVPLQMIPANGTWAPRPPPDDASDGFSFRVKGGLVIELCFRVCPNDGLGSFVGWPDFHLLSIPTR